MKNKRKSSNPKGIAALQMLCVAIAIAVLGVVAIFGIGSSKAFSLSDIRLGLDLAGGVSITYEATDKNPGAEAMSDTVYKLQKRVDNYSTEANVYQEGTNRINVDIPGVKDANKILEELGKAGALEFRLADGTVVVNGSDISSAEAVSYQDKNGAINYAVSLTFNPAGAKKFAKATTENVGKIISIYYDGKEVNSPRVKEPITDGKGQIEQGSMEEAKTLASTIRIGALPLTLNELRSNIVGAKLGSDAINTSLLAGAIGFALVAIFMICWYRLPGFAASLALTIYVGLMLFLLNLFKVTLTLPGIAGIILSIGMAVDANVIIFTRIREEIATGKTVRSSIKIGFDKALSAIVDGNVTTLIAAFVLYFGGSGTVKGFATTLALGILLSMFTALFVTRFILNAFFALGATNENLYGIQKEVKVFNFIKHTRVFFTISIITILIGFVAMGVNKANGKGVLNFGLDFQGGTSTQITFPEDQKFANKDEVGKIIASAIGDLAETSQVQDENTFIVKTRELTQDERAKITKTLVKDYKVDESTIQVESISGTVSGEMKRDAIVSVLIATVCMLIYIWIRFKDINFGTSAVLALCHDVLVVLMVYAVGRISVGSTFIACMLTIVGYSINATIVIFDRVRENLKAKTKKETYEDVVNTSISQTISRSINTSLTTFIMVFVLFLLGVDAIREFALPLMAGIICGAYSSICVTGTLWYFFKKRVSKVQ